MLHKLRTNRQLTATDLEKPERIMLESGTGMADDVARARAAGLGMFVRTLVGLRANA